MNWKNLINKVMHGAIIAVGSVLPAIVSGAVSPVMAAKLAVGALVTYLIKPARPDSDVVAQPVAK